MQIIDNKALLLRLKNPSHVVAAVDKAKIVGQHEVVVKWDIPTVHRLRAMNIKVPSPIEGRYNWPGRFKPMSHQKDTASFLTRHKRAFCFSEQGTGKTASTIWAADYLMTAGYVRRVLVICPVSIMAVAWKADLFSFAMHRTVGIAYGSAEKRRKVLAQNTEFVIINYEGVEIVKDEIINGGFDLIVIDECFVAGTQVHTPMGKTPIENLKVGDSVFTSDGVRNIKTVSKRKPAALVEVKLETGERITCTPEHPFFTDWGWVPARALAGRRIVSMAALSDVRNKLHSVEVEVGLSSEGKNAQWNDLLSILRSEEMAPNAPGGIGAKVYDAGAEGEGGSVWVSSHVGAARAFIEGREISGSEAHRAGRQRHGYDTGRNFAIAATAGWLDLELPSSVGREASRLSYELQARLRMAGEETWVGSGWKQPSHNEGSGAGSEENGKAFGARVDSVTHREPGCDEYVYNIEVDGTPNYFVGDSTALVHNCTHYKNVASKRWKALNAILKANPDTWLWMLTGTPAAQGPIDAYGLAKLVNPTNVQRTFGGFRDAVMFKVTQFKWAPKPDAHETVHRVLQPAIRYTKDECLDLPDLLYVKREVELTKQQKSFYEKLRKELYMEASGSTVSAVNSAVGMNKLLQIACGAVYDDSKDILEFDISKRYSVLKEVIDEASKKILVFVPYKHVIDLLAETMRKDGYSLDIIRGDVPVDKRTEIFNKFQREADPHILLIQPQSAAHGVTLTAADTVVWWSPTSSLETYAQANARVHRSGQTHKCTVVQLQGSPVERRLYSLLDDRIDVHTKVVDLYKELLD